MTIRVHPELGPNSEEPGCEQMVLQEADGAASSDGRPAFPRWRDGK